MPSRLNNAIKTQVYHSILFVLMLRDRIIVVMGNTQVAGHVMWDCFCGVRMVHVVVLELGHL